MPMRLCACSVHFLDPVVYANALNEEAIFRQHIAVLMGFSMVHRCVPAHSWTLHLGAHVFSDK
jgi:hypothetical protein